MKLISSLLLFCGLAAFAQDAKQDSAYVADYRKLRDLYVLKVEARHTNNSRVLYNAFADKAHFKGTREELISANGLINWVRQNIEKTDFKNVEEAEAEWVKVQQTPTAISPDELAFIKAMTEVSKVHGMEIVTDVMMNKGIEGEDVRQDPKFEEALKKLTALVKKQQGSDSYREWRSLESAYMKKANFVSKKDKLEFNESLFDWVEKNLSKTMFSSVFEAKREWAPVEKAKKAEQQDNAEYHEFYLYAVERFGPYVFTDAMDNFLSGN